MVLKRKKGLLLAIFVIIAALALITSGTIALFNTKVRIVSHFESGTLTAELLRVGHEKMYLGDEDGKMHKTTVAMGEESTEVNDLENVFELAEDDYIVPQCKQVATFKITNGGNVAFDLLIQLVLHNGEQDSKESDEELLEQLSVTVERITSAGVVLKDDEEHELKITRSGDELSDDTSFELEGFAPESVSYFRVSVEFIDDDDINNDAMTQNAYFDLIINAIQSTEVIDD